MTNVSTKFIFHQLCQTENTPAYSHKMLDRLSAVILVDRAEVTVILSIFHHLCKERAWIFYFYIGNLIS